MTFRLSCVMSFSCEVTATSGGINNDVNIFGCTRPQNNIIYVRTINPLPLLLYTANPHLLKQRERSFYVVLVIAPHWLIHAHQ